MKILPCASRLVPNSSPNLSCPARSTSHPLVSFSKPKVEGESGDGRQNDPDISAPLMQGSRSDAAEGKLLYEGSLSPASALSFWANTSCLTRTLLQPPPLHRAVTPRATASSGSCQAATPLPTLVGGKFTPWQSVRPVPCATHGAVTVTPQRRGLQAPSLLSCAAGSGGLSFPTRPRCLLQAGGRFLISLWEMATLFLSPPLPGKGLAGTAHAAHQRLLKTANKIAGSNRSRAL